MKPGGFHAMGRICLVMALASLITGLLGGALGALFYVEGAYGPLRDAGLTLQIFRPLHTTFVTSWIVLGANAVMFFYLGDRFGEPTPSERRRFKFQMFTFMAAGLGILVTTLLRVGTGREYMEFHPAFSPLILSGWLAFAWTFFGRVSRGILSQGVHVYMWAAAIPYFAYTFIEGHAWMLEGVIDYPLRDLAIQWKHCGTLVGAFNHMVYGAMFYMTERYTGNLKLAHSWRAFGLFGVGLLNSFSNFGHHTYHLPGQDQLIRNISFVVSMLEVVFIFTILLDIRRILRARVDHGEFAPAMRFANLAVFWNGFMMPLNILISIPVLNTFIHGTHLVLVHAMGQEVAIDSYMLFACGTYFALHLNAGEGATRLLGSAARRAVTLMNLALVCFVSFLFLSGVVSGVCRYYLVARPAWVEHSKFLFAFFGFPLGIGLVVYALILIRSLGASSFRGRGLILASALTAFVMVALIV